MRLTCRAAALYHTRQPPFSPAQRPLGRWCTPARYSKSQAAPPPEPRLASGCVLDLLPTCPCYTTMRGGFASSATQLASQHRRSGRLPICHGLKPYLVYGGNLRELDLVYFADARGDFVLLYAFPFQFIRPKPSCCLAGIRSGMLLDWVSFVLMMLVVVFCSSRFKSSSYMRSLSIISLSSGQNRFRIRSPFICGCSF